MKVGEHVTVPVVVIDADARIGVACKQRGVKIELIVRLQGEHGQGGSHSGAIEPLAAVRAGGGDDTTTRWPRTVQSS
jgi:hypothetical protein